MQYLIWNINLLVLDSYDSSAKFYISRPAGAWLDHLNCSKKTLAFLLLVFRQSMHRCLG